MSAVAAVNLRSSDLDSAVALIASPETEALQALIGCSRWQIRELPDANAARSEIERGDCPVVMCGTADWRGVIDSANRAARKPGVIVVANRADDLEWLQVLEAGGHYVPLDKLNRGHLFSLLNILWRSWHKGYSR